MKVISAVVNNPIFICIQYETLKRYMKIPYEFIVFNDAKAFPDYSNFGNAEVRGEITRTCAALGVQCVELENNHHRYRISASDRTADSMNAIFAYMRRNVDTYLILDSDMFLIDDFYGYDVAYAFVKQTRDALVYPWNGLVYMDMTRLEDADRVDWNCGAADTGGEMAGWLARRDAGTIHWIKHLMSCGWTEKDLPPALASRTALVEFVRNDVRGAYFCEIYDNKFFHYRAGGNWMKQNPELHRELTLCLQQVLLGAPCAAAPCAAAPLYSVPRVFNRL